MTPDAESAVPSVEEHVAAILASEGDARGGLISILQKIQAHFGYLPEDAMRMVAERLRMPESSVYSAASFYAQFRFTPVGKKQIHVCRGTACHVRGGTRVLDQAKQILGIAEGETTPDMEYTLETVACLGCCALAPCAMVDGKVEAQMTAGKMRDLLSPAEGADEA